MYERQILETHLISSNPTQASQPPLSIMPTGHAKATVGDVVIAEADAWEEVEGNVYFPPASVMADCLSKTDLSTHCPWKGDASYYTIKAGGKPHILPTTLERWAWIADPSRLDFVSFTQ